MKANFLFILSILFSVSVLAQRQQSSGQPQADVVVRGLVVDGSDNSPLPGAHITLTHMRDTTRIFRGITSERGHFNLTVARGGYQLRVTYLGFEPITQTIRATETSNDIGRIAMGMTEAMLGEVVVTGQAATTVQRGDTTAYNAAAFKTNPDASAEDLIRKMPGITVEGGQVTAQGEQVRRVLVDGQEFFGDDPNIALRNLPAEMIAQIEVFDRMSDQAQLTGFDDGQAIKTINIVTRLDRRNGQFGRVYSGYGDERRYQAGLVTNIFLGQRRISILGMSNNINQQNFSSEDLSGFFGSTRGGARGMGGGGGRPPMGGGAPSFNRGDFMIGQQSGLNNTNSLGLNFTDRWKDKVNVNASYFFNLMKNDTERFSDRIYYIDDEASQNYLENNLSDSRNMNHRFSGRFEYRINDNNTLIVSPRFNYQDTRSNSLNEANTFLPGFQFLNQSLTDYNRNWDGYSLSNNMTYRLRLNEKGRSLSTTLNLNANNNKYLYLLDAVSEYYQGPVLIEDLIDQQSDSKTSSMGVSSNINYTEPLGGKSMLQLSYNLSFSDNESNRLTNSWDIESQSYTIFENELSSELTNGYLTNRAGLSYMLRDEKYNLQAGVSFQNASLSAEQTTPYFVDLSRNFQSILPSFRFTYNFSRTQNMRLFYRTSTNAPSVNQLQDVVDNTNPLLLTTGNPSLKQSYSHFGNIRFSLSNPAKSRTFMLFLFGNLTNDFVATSTIIAARDTIINGYEIPRGGQFSRPENLSGYGNVRSMLTYGFMVNPIKTNINFTSGLGYTRSPGLVNGQKNVANTTSVSGGVVLSSNISQNIDFTLSYNANYNVVENSLRPQLDNNYFYHLTGMRFNWIFLKNWVLRNDVNNLLYTGLGEDFNQNYWLWNMNLGRKFLANNQGELTLGVYDLLDQNKSVSRNVTSNYVEDVRANVLNRFFMLTFTYNIRNFGAGQPAR
ncbi:MAG: outer membrane beta-barrel protein [Bacteroidales bacterium]|nr:outer membrane beta-barrel protein [Bacteroidales bacterium]